MEISGFATPEGTARYRERFAGRAAEGHFRERRGLWLSSVGIGTYLGEHDEATDERYARAVARALELGANVVDTAINYRFQRSERAVGAALHALLQQGKLARDEVVVASKAGFLTFDADPPPDPHEYFDREYFQPGVIKPEDVVAGMHCMTPRYLADQLERSRRNLGLATLDVYFLHNPETQLAVLPRAEFLSRVRAAFRQLEEFVAAGKIRCYGTATWDGYRQSPQAHDFLSLPELVEVAREVAGANHHFSCVQLPYNLSMPEALLHSNQPMEAGPVPLLEAAERLGITVFASASLLQGQVARNLPSDLRAAINGALETDAQRALQFVRSTPGVGAALVGMRRLEHVEENLRLVEKPLVSPETFRRVFLRGPEPGA